MDFFTIARHKRLVFPFLKLLTRLGKGKRGLPCHSVPILDGLRFDGTKTKKLKKLVFFNSGASLPPRTAGNTKALHSKVSLSMDSRRCKTLQQMFLVIIIANFFIFLSSIFLTYAPYFFSVGKIHSLWKHICVSRLRATDLLSPPVSANSERGSERTGLWRAWSRQSTVLDPA